MSDIVKIKGLKSGLQLSFANGARFEDVQANILNKLETGSNFFVRGTTVFMSKGQFTEEQVEILRKMFHRHGMLFSMEFKQPSFSAPTPKYEKPVEVDIKPVEKKSSPMLVINKTIRGGQEVRTESSVLICGNVNPGAQVISGGSVDIRGTCRGSVHAGANGDTSAYVVADRLMPMQIRIADVIARSPDNMEKAVQAERASIKNGQIIIEPITR